MTGVYRQWTTSNTDQWRSETPTDEDFQWQPVALATNSLKLWVSKSIIYDYEAYNRIYVFKGNVLEYAFESINTNYTFISKVTDDDF